MSAKALAIASELTLPLDAATQTFAFIARRGAGKTYAAGKLVEELLQANVQCVILDAVGNWYGLRLAANGKDFGFDIPVIGGLRGDIPLEAEAGKLLADVVVQTGRSLILDISQFSLANRKRFATSFGEHLWLLKKGQKSPTPLMLVIEESQLIVPQFAGKDEARMLGVYEEIIRLGRNYGVGCTMISQRPQSVNKEVLNQTECLFVGQVNGAAERKALRDWIVHQGMETDIINELPALPAGTMYVWSPQWLNVLCKVKILKKRTYDSTATPRVGDRRQVAELKSLDLDELNQSMADMIERTKQDDPKELRRRIAELERSVRVTSKQVDQELVAKLQASLKDAQVKLAEATRDAKDIRSYIGRVVDNMKGLIAAGAKFCEAPKWQCSVPLSVSSSAPAKTRVYKEPSDRLQISSRPTSVKPTVEVTNSDKLRAGAERMLAALCQWSPQGMTEGQMRAHAGMRKSGTFSTYMSDLRRSGYVENRQGLLYATDAGMSYFGTIPAAPATTQEVLDVWLPKLREGARRMLTVLVERRGRLTREALAEASGMSNSGTFSTYLSDLKTANLVVCSNGKVEANSETLFL